MIAASACALGLDDSAPAVPMRTGVVLEPHGAT